MPFQPTPPTPQPAPPQQYPDREPLLRLGGLWTSRNGNSLQGNIRLSYARLGEPNVGEQLIALIQRCLDEGGDLRFLIFESRYPGKGAPYSLQCTFNPPRAPNAPVYTPPSAPEPDGDEPATRPVRRTAPRR